MGEPPYGNLFLAQGIWKFEMADNTVDIMEIAESGPGCIIYGAGMYGQKILHLLTISGLKDKVKCFVVTGALNDENKVMGLSVLPLEKAKETYPKAAVFIAIKGAWDLYEKVSREYDEVFFCQKEEIDLLYCRMFAKLWENPIKHNKLFFISNWGKGYLCNGKYITEELIRQKQDVDMVWAVEDIRCKTPAPVRKVLVDSPEYYYEMATSGVWVDNCRKDIHVQKREGQYYIQTWHGSGPLKKVERDAENALSPEYIRRAKHDGEMIDLFLSSTSANSAMYRDSFYSHGEIFECGSPRNDILFNRCGLDPNKIRASIGLGAEGCKIVLFAPTFRRTVEDSVKACDLDGDRVVKELEKRFGTEFVMLVKFHPNLSGDRRLKSLYSNCIHVTDYEDTQELLAVSDVLITDYSSVLWDFSLQRKPVFLYQNDEKEYLDERGFYCPPSQWPYPRAFSHEELYEKIKGFDERTYVREVDNFLRRWNSFDDGHASQRAAERIMDVIRNPKR